MKCSKLKKSYFDTVHNKLVVPAIHFGGPIFSRIPFLRLISVHHYKSRDKRKLCVYKVRAQAKCFWGQHK